MKDNVELSIGPDGTLRTMYQDGVEKFAEEMGGEITTSCRASDVEWEDDGTQKGWTVRSAYDKDLAIRSKESGAIIGFKCAREGNLHFFKTREDALKVEVTFFWELLAPKTEGNNAE